MQVYSTRQAKADIDAVYSMGLFEDVHILPQPAENSTVDHPKADVILNVVERKTAGLSAGGGISATVSPLATAAAIIHLAIWSHAWRLPAINTCKPALRYLQWPRACCRGYHQLP